MTFNANDFNAPEVEIVATNTSNDEGLEDVTALPFGHDAEEKETGTDTEIVSPTATATGSEFTSDSLDVEQANEDASASSPKAKTMKDVLFKYGYGLAVAVVIALAGTGKGFAARAHNDPPGTDDMIMNADFSKDSSKQVAVAALELEGDGKNVAGYDFTEVGGSGGMPSERSLEQAQDPIIYEFVGNGKCSNSNNEQFDYIEFRNVADVNTCKAKCAECPGQGQAAGRELRGIYYVANFCYCLLQEGALAYRSDCNGAWSAGNFFNTTGAICDFYPNSAECWKVVDSNLQCPTLAPSTSPTAQPTSAPTNVNTKASKVAKVAKANGIVDLQVQEMKSGGSSVSISPHVGILVLIVASRNLYLLL